MRKKYTIQLAVEAIKKHGFVIEADTIYGIKAKGTNGTGGAIDFLVGNHNYTYLPNDRG